MNLSNPMSSNNNKRVSGSAKVSKGSSKISRRKLVLFVAMGVLLATVGGTYGYTKYKADSLEAKAGQYAMLINRGGVTAAACKKGSPYGYVVSAIATKPPGMRTSNLTQLSVSTYKQASGGPVVQRKNSNTWWASRVTAVDVYAGGADAWYSINVGGQTTGRVALAYTPSC